MLMLSRRIDEAINVYVHFDRNPVFCKMIREFGIDPQWFASVCEVITITPTQFDNPTGQDEEIVIGIDAARHVDIVRSEIDRKSY